MGKLAWIHSSSTTRLAIRLFVLMLLVPTVSVGCRGPWFQKNEGFDPLVITEKGEARTPRAFASSRLRPSAEDNSRNSAPNPSSSSQRISDDSDEVSLGEDYPAAAQKLFQLQMKAAENLRAESAGDHEDLLAEREPQEDKEPLANFKMSDDGESSSFSDNTVVEKPKNKAKEKQSSEPKESQPKESQPKARPPKSTTKPSTKDEPHPLSRSQERIKNTKITSLNVPPREKAPQDDSEEANSQVVKANATEDVDSVDETKIKIETAKSDWRVLTSEASSALQAELDSGVALSPEQRLSIEGKLRLFSLILDDLEAAMTPIEKLQTPEQEFFQHEVQAIHAAIDPKGNPVLNRRWTLALESHRKAQMSLAAVSNLEIHNATFCTEVDSFGILNKFPQYHFRQKQELLLYCELDNFVSTPVKDGFETQLQGSYEILDSSGRRVADQLLPPDEHICRNQRRDYFIAYRIYTPQDIKPGKYTLKLTIEDMKGHKFGQTNVEFQVIP